VALLPILRGLLRAALYTRLSQDREGTATSTDRQEADCRGAADRLGARVVRVYSDPDASAFRKGARRPAFEDMLSAFGRGEFDAVVVWRVDRLARAAREWARLLPLVDDGGLRIVGAADGVDTATQGGRLILGILGEVARQEASTIGMRVSRAHRAKAERGEPHVSRDRGFGHTANGKGLVEGEAVEVRVAVGRIIAGDSLAAILRDWRERGVRTTRGGGWGRTVARRMLTSARIAGCREVDGRLVPGLPQIVTVDELVRVRAVLMNPDRHGRRLSRGAALLSGLVVCGRCGEKMYAATMNGRRVYRCFAGAALAGCGRTNIRLEATEGEVGGRVVAVLPRLVVERREDDSAVRLRELDARRADLAAEYAAGRISRGEWSAAREAVSVEAEHLAGRLASVRAAPSGDLEAAWRGGDVAARRSILAALVARVVILPHAGGARNVWRPERVVVEWRGEAEDAG
jgi:site-specific DNA recombinase